MTASHVRICSIGETMLYGFPNSANFCPDYVGHESSEEYFKNHEGARHCRKPLLLL